MKLKSNNDSLDKTDAVSEVVGYIIILGIVIMSIGMVLNSGFPVIQDAQQGEHMENVQKTFEILQNNFDEIVERDVPARATELKMVDSDLQTRESTFVHIGFDDPDLDNFSRSRPIVYTRGDSDIMYESGAVFSGQFQRGNNSAMLYEPNWRFDEDFVVVREITTRGENSISGDGTPLIRGDATSRGYEASTDQDDTLYIAIESPNAGAWHSYLERELDGSGLDTDIEYEENPSPMTEYDRVSVEVELDTDGKIIRTGTNIGVEIS